MTAAVRLTDLAERNEGLVLLRRHRPADLSEEGIRSRAKRGRLQRLAPRLYRIPGSPPTWHQQLRAAVAAAGAGAVVSHRSAAALWELPGFRPGPVDVTRVRRAHHSGLLGTVHESRGLPDSHKRVVDGIAVTSVARTLFDLCGDRAVHPLRAQRAMANALARKIVTWPELAVMAAEMCRRGRRGSALFRRLTNALGMNGHRPTDSELENLMLTVIREAGLPLPETQVELGDETGRIGRVDGYYRTQGVVVEADSERYHSSWLDQEADRERDARLAALGLRVIRVTWRQLTFRRHAFTTALASALHHPIPRR